ARLNGVAAPDAALHDGDTLQIGTFSFEVRLPAEPPPVPSDPSPPVEIGLGDTTWFASQQADLQRRREQVEALESDVEARLRQLRRGREEPAAQRARLEQERAAAAEEARQRREEELARLEAEGERHARNAPSTAEAEALDRRASELGCYARHL